MSNTFDLVYIYIFIMHSLLTLFNSFKSDYALSNNYHPIQNIYKNIIFGITEYC